MLQRARAVDRRRPLLWDVTLALAVAAISVKATGGVSPLGIVPLVLSHGAVVFRRRRPFGALLVAVCGVLLGTLVSVLAGVVAPWAYLAVWVLLFDVGLRERGRRAVVVASGVVALTVAVGVVAPTGVDVVDLGDLVRTSVALLATGSASLLLGLQIRGRREYLTAQRAEAARAAVVAERSRIAQEMHDVIGHNLSVITSLANGGAVAARTSPEDAAQAFDAIGAVSRSSVREVARVLAVLRHDHSWDGASLTPQPGLADLADLVESMRSAGVTVSVTRGGSLRSLSAGRQLAVYRIVQESLTNALRHAAPGTAVRVSILREGGDVLVTVDDDGSVSSDGWRVTRSREGEGLGYGILGMRERAEAYGGSLEAAPFGSGWRVSARIRADAGEEQRGHG